jgi:hypothetical protein
MPYDPHNDPVLRAMLAEVRLLLPEFQHTYDAKLRMKLHTLSQALRQRSQALLTMLYRSTDRLRRRGAPV